MFKRKSVYFNIMLNIVRTLIYVVFPLITFPYVSRVLMAENLGKVNYGMSVESYFALIASLGISTYGVREGARLRSDTQKLNNFVNEVFTVNIITMVFSYALLLLLLFFVPSFKEYRLLIILQSTTIFFVTLGVDWLNSVFEDYLYITVRSLFIQIFLLILLLVIVRKPDDYYKYAFLTVCSSGIVSILNYIYTRKKYCKVQLVFPCNFKKHIRPLLILFANSLAVNLYLNADVTMLGLFTNNYTVGIYAVSVKVYTIIKSLIAAMFTACMPRLSAYYGEEKRKEYKELLNDIISICTLLMIPAISGMIVLAKPIVLLLSGSNYLDSVHSLRIISIGIIGAIYGGIMTNCINLPEKREKYNLKGTIIAAIVNIVLNLVFIPLFGERGAATTTVVAEFTVLVYCIISYPKIQSLIKFNLILKQWFFGCLGAAFIVASYYVGFSRIENSLLQLITTFVVSIMGYTFILIIFKNEYIIRALSHIHKRRI